MEPSFTSQELNTLMDITFLFQSVRDLNVMSGKFLQMLGKIVPYEKAAVFLYQSTKHQFSCCAEVRCGGGLIRDYADRYFTLDYLGWQLFQSEDSVFLESDCIRAEDRQKTKFYQEFMRRHDVEYRLILSGKSSAGELLGMVMLLRSRMLEDFSRQEVALLELLRNHFSAGIENALHFERLVLRENMAQKVYRTVPDVIMLLDEELNVQESNEAGEQYLAHLEGSPTAQKEFFRTIRACCREMKEDSTQTDFRQCQLNGGTTKINMVVHPNLQGGMRREFVVVFSEEQTSGADTSQTPSAESCRTRFFETLSRQYSLTRREVALIKLALEGMENQRIAEKLHISLFTVKSHFRNGYAKLGVKSRQELFTVYMNYLISEQFRQKFDAQTRKDEYL